MSYIPTEQDKSNDAKMFKALDERFNEIRAELHRVGQAEFIRLYQTGPLKPLHLMKL